MDLNINLQSQKEGEGADIFDLIDRWDGGGEPEPDAARGMAAAAADLVREVEPLLVAARDVAVLSGQHVELRGIKGDTTDGRVRNLAGQRMEEVANGPLRDAGARLQEELRKPGVLERYLLLRELFRREGGVLLTANEK
jgi:hypothetical protein